MPTKNGNGRPRVIKAGAKAPAKPRKTKKAVKATKVARPSLMAAAGFIFKPGIGWYTPNMPATVPKTGMVRAMGINPAHRRLP